MSLDLHLWFFELERKRATMRPSSDCYRRFDAHARQLAPWAVRVCPHVGVLKLLERELRAARYPTGHRIHDLDRVWSRAELGELIVTAEGRRRQLEAGNDGRQKGPRLDPRQLPDDRLDWLIQRHRDMNVVEALRAERRRRGLAGMGGDQ